MWSKAGWLESTPITDPGVLAAKALIDAAPDPRLVFNDPTFVAAAQAGTYGAQWQELTTDAGGAPSLAALQSGGIVEYARPTSGISRIVQSPLFATAVKSVIALGGGVLGALGVKAMAATASAPSPTPPPVTQAQVDVYYAAPTGATMFDSANFDWGSTLTGLVGAALNYRNQRAQTAMVSGAVALPGGVPVSAQNVGWFPALPSIGAMGARLLPSVGAVGAVAMRAGRYIATAIGNITKQRVVAIAKTLGIQAAATALGLGAVEIAQMVLDEEVRVRRRRRGGITGAQMKTTRRTIGKVERLHRQIVAACSSARVPSRRRALAAAPHHHHFARKR